MTKLTVKDIIESLKQFTILEVNELVKTIESEFNISASFAPSSGSSKSDDSSSEQDSPSVLNLHLVNAGNNKIAIIKLIREMTGLGLMDAKKLTDTTPSLIKEQVASAEFDDIKKKFSDAGAVVEFK